MTLNELLALLPLLLPLGGFLYKLLVSLLPRDKAEQLAHVSNLVGTVVTGVEQASGSGMSGTMKKTAAVKAVNDGLSFLVKKGLAPSNLPVSLIDMLIEEAVYALNQEQGKSVSDLPAPAVLPAPEPAPAPQPGLMGFQFPNATVTQPYTITYTN